MARTRPYSRRAGRGGEVRRKVRDKEGAVSEVSTSFSGQVCTMARGWECGELGWIEEEVDSLE